MTYIKKTSSPKFTVLKNYSLSQSNINHKLAWLHNPGFQCRPINQLCTFCIAYYIKYTYTNHCNQHLICIFTLQKPGRNSLQTIKLKRICSKLDGTRFFFSLSTRTTPLFKILSQPESISPTNVRSPVPTTYCNRQQQEKQFPLICSVNDDQQHGLCSQWSSPEMSRGGRAAAPRRRQRVAMDRQVEETAGASRASQAHGNGGTRGTALSIPWKGIKQPFKSLTFFLLAKEMRYIKRILYHDFKIISF